MKSLTLKTVSSRITSIVNASNHEALQEVFVNAVLHGLVHGNIMPAALKALRDSKAPAKFKAAIAKHMPAKWDKKASKYVYDAKKADKLLETLDLVREKSTLEEVAAALPNIFTVTRTTREYDRARYMVTVAHHLTANGEPKAEEITAIMAALLENPELINKAARAIVNGAQASKAA